MKDLARAAESFLECNRRLGYKMEHHTLYLRDFVSFMERKGASVITNELALEWAMGPQSVTPHTWAFRLRTIRRFARYRFLTDKKTEIPPNKLLSTRYWRRHPHIYSKDEIHRLLEAARNNEKPFWGIEGHTLYALIGLVASTGLRRCEAINLNVEDVNLKEGTLAIKMTKFHKSRMLPIHGSVVKRLREYLRLRGVQPNLKTNAVFVTKRGTRLPRATIHFSFVAASRQAGLRKPTDSTGPRLHDLRHTYAVTTLVDWLRRGIDVDSKIPILSTYMGHTRPTNTYWYFSCVPELMNLARLRMEKAARGLA